MSYEDIMCPLILPSVNFLRLRVTPIFFVYETLRIKWHKEISNYYKSSLCNVIKYLTVDLSTVSLDKLIQIK